MATQPGPYRTIAADYDRVIGARFFDGLRRTFEVLVPQYAIRFSSAADLGCGTGTFARYLNRRWRVPVFAIDRSRGMLRVARRNDASPSAPRAVHYLAQDLREFRLPHPVGLITANHDTLNHLLRAPDLRAVFRRVRQALEPGGHFLFDIVTPAGVRGRTRFFRRTLPGGGKTLHRVRAIANSDFFETVLWYDPVQASPTVVRNVERAVSADAACAGLTNAGLRVRAVRDAGDLSPARPDSGRVLVLAVRQPCVAHRRKSDA